jgi:predicted TIM-barrel fold metal-dependent hydrolase
MVTRKTERELPIAPPVDFHPVSNGEFSPLPPAGRGLRAERLWRELVEDKHRRLGMTRRQFAESACGMAAALHALNLAGCGSSSRAGTSGDSPGLGGRAGYDVDAGMLDDAGKARERLSGSEFILDVQVHVSTPLTPWITAKPPNAALDFITQIFVQSDTTVACVTGSPEVRDLGPPHVEGHSLLQAIVERFGGPRLIFHANADAERGPAELDYMADLASRYTLGAFKVYPHAGARRLDSDELGSPFLAQAEALGVGVIAAHRGISTGGGYESAGSPVDVVRAAKKFPKLKFLVYHSGWESRGDENHAFDPHASEFFGVDRFIRALLESGIGPQGNVYAELGSTFYNLMGRPEQAAHVLGKLLKQLGPERVLYGTDSVFNGVPQAQIVALRSFTIPESMQETYGYPALTKQVRERIFGLNAAAVYGVDPAAVRYAIGADDVERLRLAYREDPRSLSVPHRHTYLGPRTRREFLALIRRDGGVPG